MFDKLNAYPLLAQPFAAASTGEAILIARDRADVVYLSPLRHRPDASLNYRRPLDTPGFAARAALQGSEVVGLYVDYRGVRVLSGGRRLLPTSWALVVKVDEDEALADFRSRMRRTAAEGAAVLVAVFGVAWGVWQRRERLQLAALAKSAARIGQLNRLLKTISEINQLIVRTDEKEALLTEACRILVEHGGFGIAWVGLVDRGAGRVVPAARAGAGAQSLDEITVRFSEMPTAWGSMGTAIRTGQHAVVPDLAAEPTIAPWRDEILALGFRTTGAFPLRVRGEVAGVLTVYAAEAGTIGDEETALLDELAADLGYALEGIEERAARREGERALLESEARYRNLFESNPHTMLVYDRESLRFLAVNDTAVAKYGYSREEFLSMTVPDLHDPKVREKLVDTVRNVPGVVRLTGVWPQLRKDGSIVEAEITTHDLTFAGRDARLVLAVDVTQRLRAESAIRRSRETMIGLLDASPDSTLLVNPDGVVLACNRVMAARLGKSFTEIVGSPVWDLLPPEIVRARRQRVEEAVRTGKTVRFRDERSGRTIDNTIVPIDAGSGGVRQLAVFGRDVTDLVRAEAELAKSELYYRSLIENALDVTAVFSPDGTLLYVSPSVERALGYRPVDLLGSKVFGIVHADDRPEVARTSRRVLEDGTRVERFEYRVRHRDGSWRSFAALGKALPPETGLRGLILNARDVTERRQLQAQLLQAQKMEAVGRLAGGVAHDFNNLLTVIQGYGEMLATSLTGDETRREEVKEILNAAGRATTLTRQLLAFSRRQVLEMRVFDLGAVVGELEKMLRRLIGEDIDLVVARPAGGCLVKADPGQVEQVLMNLAVNARDAMPKGGRLTVEVADLDLDAPLSSLNETVPPGRFVVTSVSDTGTGIDSETLAHIFEPFFTTKEKGKGTGLGLSTVFGIVKQSGGYVLVESVPGHGTTFRIFFPGVDGEGATAAPILRTQASPGGSETILLVEDEEPIRALIRTSLAAYGYTVLDAASAEEALSLSGRHAGLLHLLLTDVVLKGDSGRVLADRLLAQRPGIKVLYISGYTDDVISHHGVLEPGLVFLQKPFTPATLARKVREALESRPSEEPSPG